MKVEKADVAKGAGIVALSRLGALVEVISQPAYIWMFGIAVYGVYTVLWAAVNAVSNFIDLAMTSALQRVVPQAANENEVHSALKLALAAGVLPSVAIAATAMFFAGDLAALVNAGPAETRKMVTSVTIFAPALPLWTFIEVSTAAVRARRAFGPEVRLRLFWEQCVRLGAAFLLFIAGVDTLALVVAHVASLAVTAALALRLLGRYYDLRMVARAPIGRDIARRLLTTGLGLLPGNIVRRAFIDLPPLVLNAVIPGNPGAVAAGLFGIARKIATVPQLVQHVFLYVLAPLASAQAAIDRAAIAPLYTFATRLSTVVVVPLAAAMCLLGELILSLFSPAATAALAILVILVSARAIDALLGPASVVLDMIGHKLLPTVNSIAGVGVWAAVGWWRIPLDGAAGMAWGVGAGIVARALLAVLQLRIGDGFTAFDWRFAKCVLIGGAAAAVMAMIHLAVRPYGPIAEIAAVLTILVIGVWSGLRFGLAKSDRIALGPLGVRIGLVPASAPSRS